MAFRTNISTRDAHYDRKIPIKTTITFKTLDSKQQSLLYSAYVIFALMCLIIAGPGSNFSLSVLVIPHQESFNISRSQSSSLISYRLTSEFVVLGLFSFVFAKLHHRLWILLSVMCLVAGHMFASFSNDFNIVCWTFGILSAFGTGVLYGVAQYSIPYYFRKSSWL